MSTDFERTWLTYASSWKARTPEERKRLYAQALAPDCRYTDPTTRRVGFDELASYMEEFHQQVPGGHFHTKWFLVHHGCSIALWDMCDGDGQKLGEGVSYGTYDQQGRLQSMTGFFETPD